MKIIAITTPKVIDEDAFIIKGLIDRGVDMIHLRKPDSTIDEGRRLLEMLGKKLRQKIVVHDYPELFDEFSLRGIHINRNVTTYPQGYDGLRTRSCHTLEEVVRYKGECDYLFLSPIFDSISKRGYLSRFDEEELRRASMSGIIDEKVVALGGVTFDKIAYLQGLNFGGVAMVGEIYGVEAMNRLRR